MKRSLFLIACSAIATAACFDSGPGDTEPGVRAINLQTGESRQYDSESDVPEGWVLCTRDGCPEPVACGELDEDVCLLRADCSPVYAESFAPECDPRAEGDAPESCHGGYVGCEPIDDSDGCDDVPVCELACPPGTRNEVDERGCIRWCECVPVECSADECGPAPLCPAILCDDGTVGGCTGECTRGADGTCGWEIRECPEPPPPEECSADECGPPPLGCPAIVCEDGSLAGCTGRCVRGEDGTCGWERIECPSPPPPEECSADECGPAPLGCPAIVCEDGSLGGCTGRCVRGEDGTCGWQILECAEDPCFSVPQCDLLCPAGTHNPVDDNGCQHSCECEPDGDGDGETPPPR